MNKKQKFWTLCLVKPNMYPSGFAYDDSFNAYRHWPQLNRALPPKGVTWEFFDDIIDLAEKIVNRPSVRFIGALIGGALVLGTLGFLIGGDGGEEVVVECEGGH